MFSPSRTGPQVKYVLTVILVVINVICYILIDLPAQMGNPELENLLIQDNAAILASAQWWRIFTAMWLHADILHIGSNMLGLLIFGISLETFTKKWQYLVIYLVSGVLGNLGYLLVAGPDPYALSLGASGAIFGVVAAALILPRKLNQGSLFVAFLYLIINILYSMGPGVNTWAHVFGALGGVIFAFIFTPSPSIRGSSVTSSGRRKFGASTMNFMCCPRCGKTIEGHPQYCPYCELPFDGAFY